MFAGQLTIYTTRHTKISYSLAYQYAQVNLQATPPDTLRSATASHIDVCRSTYILHHQTHQDQLLPRISMFAGQLTSYTTRHTKVSYSPAYQCSEINLPATPPDTPRSATASHINVRRSTHPLHHQAHQGQLQPRVLYSQLNSLPIIILNNTKYKSYSYLHAKRLLSART
jgi:hypothetical protein